MLKSTTPTVSIIIPAYNEASVIRQCLLAAINQSVSAEEILVVDNLSTDETAQIVRDMQQEFPSAGIQLLEQSDEQGITPTRNYGFNHATGEVLGRIDADSVIEADWVEQVKRAFSDETVAAATGPVVYTDMPMKEFGLKADHATRKFLSRIASKYQFLFGSNMAIRATAWQAIRHETCDDHEDKMHEDIDLSIHVASHDLKIIYVPTMVGGMSARRLEDSPKDYHYYVMRFERTYAAHAIKNPALRVPIGIYLAIYFPLKALRALHVKRGDRAKAQDDQALMLENE